MSLRERHDAAWRQMDPEIRRIYEVFLADLAAGGMTARTLKAGDRIPDFILPDSEGRLVSSAQLLARGPLVLSFFRGDWCPWCVLELQALQAVLAEIEGRGGSLVGITPDTGEAARDAKRKNNLSFPVLSDVDNGLGLLFGVVFPLPAAVRELYTRIGLDLAARHGNQAWFLPIPATFIVGSDGFIRHAEADTDFTRRMEPAAIPAILDETKR